MGRDWSREAGGGVRHTKNVEEAAGVRWQGPVVSQVSVLGGRYPQGAPRGKERWGTLSYNLSSFLLAVALVSLFFTWKSGNNQKRGPRIENTSPPRLVSSVHSRRWRERNQNQAITLNVIEEGEKGQKMNK